jgi:hypothetical protein
MFSWQPTLSAIFLWVKDFPFYNSSSTLSVFDCLRRFLFSGSFPQSEDCRKSE